MSWDQAPAGSWGDQPAHISNGPAANNSYAAPANNFTTAAASGGGHGDQFAGANSNDARNHEAGAFGGSGGYGDAAGGGFDDAAGGGFGEGGADGFGDGGGGGSGGGCFNCGQEGHMKSDCPQPPKSRGCFNCGEEGHSKVDCPNPAVAREFTGTCRLCEQQGHRAADCPSKPPTVCKNCQEEGHEVVVCDKPRKIDRSQVKDIPAEQAWALIKEAAAEREVFELKEAVEMYVKTCPDLTYPQLEEAFRSLDVPVYLIAIEKELNPTYVNMDLQGNLGKTYSITWRWSPKPRAPKEHDAWPSSPEENRTRLEDAGEPVYCLMQKCSNCDELGHTQRNCPQDKMDKEHTVVKCYNCEETGHRVRDCPNPRPDKFACRNCKQSGHSSKECTEPRSAEGVECKKCNEVGHFSRDCPQGGGGGSRACHNCGQEGHSKNDCTNERVLICRNCDAQGHVSKECPKPRDYSRVKCSNCDQMGHTKVRCQMPLKIEEGEAGTGGDNDNFGTGGDNFAAPDPGNSGENW
ncbi:hypothetical protein LZ554_000824 [Drepanopeziza brunnea f. sp. 'monogermtubi']|nr:hypothetical protein LZ554_000824 [Drepanopeziza brunnea f. sp. 'monogermtubi']